MWRTRTSLDLSARVTVKKKTPPSMHAGQDGIATWRHGSIIYRFAWLQDAWARRGAVKLAQTV